MCPQIRLFRTAINWSETPLDDVNGEWLVCSSQTVASFAATLSFFGRGIYDKTHLPLGLIVSAVDGQRIEPFIAREGLMPRPNCWMAIILKEMGIPKRIIPCGSRRPSLDAKDQPQ
ncbi:MAG: hypothetical protein NTW21_26690 [Verrucomicrobia bacterium]|nr:hypothetical protein [Verrucomicrobiota bacterium]